MVTKTVNKKWKMQSYPHTQWEDMRICRLIHGLIHIIHGYQQRIWDKLCLSLENMFW